MLAHGAVLRRNGFTVGQIQTILQDYHHAGLDAVEVDCMDLAHKLSTNPHAITPGDIQKLRDEGLTDEEILDIVLAAGLRNVYSRVLDALGVQPNAPLREEDPELWRLIMEDAPSDD